MSNVEMYKIRHARKTLEDIAEKAQALLKLIGDYNDQVDETNTMTPISEDVKNTVMAAVKIYLERPGAVVSMATTRVVQSNTWDAGGSKIFGPSTFQLTITFDERRKA